MLALRCWIVSGIAFVQGCGTTCKTCYVHCMCVCVCVCVCLTAGARVLLQPLSCYGFHLPRCHPQPWPTPWHHMGATISNSICAIFCCSYGSCLFMCPCFLDWVGLLTILSCNCALVACAKTAVNADWLRHRCFHMMHFNNCYSYLAIGVPDTNGDLQNRIYNSTSKF